MKTFLFCIFWVASISSLALAKGLDKNGDTLSNHSRYRLDTFIYKNKVQLNYGHGEVVEQTSFSLGLPAGRNTSFIRSTPEHFFFFGKTQLIFVHIEELEKDLDLDSLSLHPTEDILFSIVPERVDYYTGLNGKARKIIKLTFRKNRKHAILYRKNATIILYNIKKRNFNYFLNSIKTFKIL